MFLGSGMMCHLMLSWDVMVALHAVTTDVLLVVLQQPLLDELSGRLAAAAAFLLELARAASACSLAVQGNASALIANTAAVLREGATGECMAGH
jgi:hypothetical protein